MSLAVAAFLLASLVAEVRDGQPATVRLPGAVDDARLANPGGYFPAEPPAARVVRRIIVENVGATPLRDPDLRLNGEPILPAPLAFRDLPDLFAAWTALRFHATTDLDANRNPDDVRRAFGVTFCGDDARALAALVLARGGESRFARLQGHSAAEHRLRASDDWMLLDGDQNVFYLRWDNLTPASEADLRADPLLAFRPRVFGRHATWSADAAWQNTARFLRSREEKRKTFRLKNPPPPRSWTLEPGDRLVIDFTRSPEHALAAESLRSARALRDAACLVEWHPADDRPRAVPFPRAEESGEPGYEARGPETLQAARSQFPALRAGENHLAANGALRVTFDVQPSERGVPPAPRVDGGRRTVEAVKGADRVWWQIAADPAFRLVPPNLEAVRPFTPQIAFDGPLDETFLSPDRDYFVRARVRYNGVWSDWSEPARFRVNKPAAPEDLRIEPVGPDQMRVRWKPASGEMLVFGSDRLDFVPEVYGVSEAIRVEQGAVRESRPSQNLLATAPGEAGEALVPARAAVRLITRSNGTLSVPSPLARLAGRPARALENQHHKEPGALTGVDIATEAPVP